jgi:uncharacterized protein with PIN domain
MTTWKNTMMNQANFRFYAELNDFLPPWQRMREFTHTFANHPAIKDVIEALGIPHTEVELILVNSQSVNFSYLLQHQDRISVYPVFEAFDITSLLRVRPQPLRETRFILDVHLGKLATYLRLFGFDTWYRNDYEDAQLAQLACQAQRILLTRDIGLLKRSLVTHGYFLRETAPKQQLREVLQRFDLFRMAKPFQRCMICNGLIYPVDKNTISQQVPPATLKYYHSFYRCQSCQQIYWPGSHYQKMQAFIETIQQQNHH